MQGTRTTHRVLRHGLAQLLLWSGLYYQLPALLPHMPGDGLELAHLSSSITVAIVIWAALVPWAGRVVDMGRGTAMMRLGGGLGALLLLAITVAPAPVVPVLIAALGVPMAATLYDPCFAILLRTPGLDGSRAVTVVTLVAGLATLLTFPLAMGLAALWDWRAVMMVFAALVLVGVATIPSHEEREVTPPRAANDDTAPVAWLAIAIIALPFGLVMFSHAAILFLLPVALADQGVASWALYLPAVLGPAQIAGRLLWHRLSPHSRPGPAASILFALLLIPPVLLLLSGAHWPLVLVALLIQGALYGIHTVLRPVVAAAALHRATLGRDLGIIATVGLLMMAAAPALGTLVQQAAGYQGLIGTLLVVNLAALALSVLGLRITTKEGAWAR